LIWPRTNPYPRYDFYSIFMDMIINLSNYMISNIGSALVQQKPLYYKETVHDDRLNSDEKSEL
jgi:hypothetical protein